MWRNKMALLKDLLSEVTSQVPRRVQLMRVEAVLENIAPQLKEADQKKLAEVYIELKQLAEMLNETPYYSQKILQKIIKMSMSGHWQQHSTPFSFK